MDSEKSSGRFITGRNIMEREIQILAGWGKEELLYQYAEENITDEDFGKERVLPNGWVLRSKKN